MKVGLYLVNWPVLVIIEGASREKPGADLFEVTLAMWVLSLLQDRFPLPGSRDIREVMSSDDS